LQITIKNNYFSSNELGKMKPSSSSNLNCVVLLFEKLVNHLEYLLLQVFGEDPHHRMFPIKPNLKKWVGLSRMPPFFINPSLKMIQQLNVSFVHSY
jgi:hypothetical protein